MANKSTKKSSPKGKKGGVSAVSPEIIGAVTGAAIGGAAGLMLANQKTRENLATVKDKAIDTAGSVLENVKIDTSEMDSKVEDVSKYAGQKIDKSLSKKTK
jgi:gas vesicle protein